MPTYLAPDIERRITQDFDGDDAAQVRQLLLDYRDPFGRTSDRVLRCVLQLSEGDLDKFLHNLDVAKTDYRDVIYWAEYDRDDNRIRDFTKPFPD